MHKTRGDIIAGDLFILPGVISIMALSVIYAAFGKVGFVAALFFGLKAAVLAIVIQAVARRQPRATSARTGVTPTLLPSDFSHADGGSVSRHHRAFSRSY